MTQPTIESRLEDVRENQKAQYRYAVWPDADKDSVHTFSADLACLGFHAGHDACQAETFPLLKEAIEDLQIISKQPTPKEYEERQGEFDVDTVALDFEKCVLKAREFITKVDAFVRGSRENT